MDAGREQLDGWGVVEDDWEQFRETVREQYGQVEPYINRELEDAAREFLDDDAFAPLEERVRRVAEATGRSFRTDGEKNPRTRSSGGDRTRVWASIHAGLKHKLEVFANENDLPKWKVLTAVVRDYNEGGRAQRFRDWLSSDVVTEVERGLADINPKTTDNLSKSERIEIAIAQRLGDQFSEDDLADAIDAETSGSDYYHDTYGPQVINRKGVKRWEKEDGPDMFFSPEVWAEKKTMEIFHNLGGTMEICEDGTTKEVPPPPFTKEEFAQAALSAGVDVSEENRETVNDYKERLLSRKGYEWNDETEQFEPVNGDKRTRPGGDADLSGDTNSESNRTDEEDESGDVDERMDAPTDEADYVRADGR